MTSAGDTPSDWLACGQGLQRTLLLAAARGLQASFLNQPVQIPSWRRNLRHTMATHRYPQLILRMGNPAIAVAPTVRRPIDTVLDTDGGLHAMPGGLMT